MLFERSAGVVLIEKTSGVVLIERPAGSSLFEKTSGAVMDTEGNRGGDFTGGSAGERGISFMLES